MNPKALFYSLWVCRYADDLTYAGLETAFVFMLLLRCTMMSGGSVGWREEGISGDLYFTLEIFFFFNAIILYLQFSEISWCHCTYA